MPGDPFVIDVPATTPIRRAAFRVARPLLRWALQVDALAEVYRALPTHDADGFADRVLRALGVAVRCRAGDVALLPRRGPLVVAANHPHGALDGLLLAALLARVRPDVRLLANHLLARIPELRASCFFVDPFDGPEAAARSRAGLRAAHLWLRHGGAVVVFPAGAVAHTRRPDGSPADAEWRDTVGRLALQTGATMVPAHIAGGNSRLFYTAGRVHPLIRTALLPREMLRKRDTCIEVRIGRAVPARPADGGVSDPFTLTTQTRTAVEHLARRHPPFVDAAAESAAEIARLPGEACLARSGAMRVFCATASEIPATLLEIGRLRAVAYAAAGEGTGRARDLDGFDERYLHLFSWDADARCVVGAYRIGQADRLVSSHGVTALYTRSLFRYEQSFVERVSPALELGRAFVRLEYQRNHGALLLLWKGIGRFVARHPEHRVLFGPVSISARYSKPSQALLRAFLTRNHFDEPLGSLVTALNPPPARPLGAVSAAGPLSVEEADRLVSSLEADGKGMPVLLRHYLRLGARLIAFNVDRGFGDVLDALMMVDLAALDAGMLARYMGRQDAALFLARHRSDPLAA